MSLLSLFVQYQKINVTYWSEYGENKTKARWRSGEKNQVSMDHDTTLARKLRFDSQYGRGQNCYSDLLFRPTDAQYTVSEKDSTHF